MNWTRSVGSRSRFKGSEARAEPAQPEIGFDGWVRVAHPPAAQFRVRRQNRERIF
jgi:hypothetical protein